jgi:insulysin
VLSRLILIFLIVATPTFASQLQQDVTKSPNDKREYAYLTLANSLEVMLISDPETDSAAASLDIQIGSSSDPEKFPGLAHFLEHMLFLGTAKYPEPDEYQKFISDHGGSHNAYTAPENTNYFFDIQADFLEGALDRFAQQFTAPLFNEEYVEREVNAVHSEFSSKIQDDGRRYLSSFKTTLSSDHPFKVFRRQLRNAKK